MSRAAIPWWRSLGAKIAAAVAGVTLAVALPLGVYVDHQSAVDARERLRSETLNRLDTASALFRSFGHLRFAATTNPTQVPPQLRDVPVGRRETYFDGSTMWAAERLAGHPIHMVLPSKWCSVPVSAGPRDPGSPCAPAAAPRQPAGSRPPSGE